MYSARMIVCIRCLFLRCKALSFTFWKCEVPPYNDHRGSKGKRSFRWNGRCSELVVKVETFLKCVKRMIHHSMHLTLEFLRICKVEI